MRPRAAVYGMLLGMTLLAAPAAVCDVPADRLARLREGGVELAGWFCQIPRDVDLAEHLGTFVGPDDADLIAQLGFGHVRVPVEWTVLVDPNEPTALRAGATAQLDAAIGLFTDRDVEVIVSLAGSFDQAVADPDQAAAAIAFAAAIAGHLSTTDPDRVLLQIADQPAFVDPLAWTSMRELLLNAMRTAAPAHTLLTATPLFFGLDGETGEPLAGTPEAFVAQPPSTVGNVVYALHYDEPTLFTSQGDADGGAWQALVHGVPYPASSSVVAPVAAQLEQEIDDPAFDWIPDAVLAYGAEEWNRMRIDERLAPVVAWGETHQAPILIDSFGATRSMPDGGGPPPPSRHNWLRDLRRAAEALDLGWTVNGYVGSRGIVEGEPGGRVPDLAAAAALGLDLRPFVPNTLGRSSYAVRLQGMWLAECIANWTGLRTEGARTAPPFLTDDDWGEPLNGVPLDFVFKDPWGADDDTDIEYVYVHLLNQHQVSILTPEQIAAGWKLHINRFIWVSNKRARDLIELGTLPPATGMGGANSNWLMIDAQLTTEMFGAMAPGMPEFGLEMGLLPMLTTSGGHATLASQFHAVLYALAAVAPPGLEGRDLVVWLVERARTFVPDGSKTADIVDFVLDAFLANPDPDDWESTRDANYLRYQANAAEHGFVYRAWYESSINFASAVLALLYGEGDLVRTIQVGTLSGWDADNPTATMGGLIGLLQGVDQVRDAFPAQTLSDRFWIYRTRDELPDYLPDDPDAEDTFPMLAERMLDIVDRAVADAGGTVDEEADEWVLPPLPDDPLLANPAWRIDGESAVRRVQAAGGAVVATSSVTGQTAGLAHQPTQFANGFEHDFDGVEPPGGAQVAYSSDAPGGVPGPQSLTVRFDRAVGIDRVRFAEGDFLGVQGGWFESLVIEIETGGVFVPVGTFEPAALAPGTPFELVEVLLPEPLWATAIRVSGPSGGLQGFVTCMEIDGFGQGVGPKLCAGDLNADGAVDGSDLGLLLAQWGNTGGGAADMNGDGAVDGADLGLLVGDWGCTASQ